MKKWLLSGVLVSVLVLGTFLVAASFDEFREMDSDDLSLEVFEEDDFLEAEDVLITGKVLDKASFVALEHIGEGRVTETEVGDEEGYYEIEVTMDNGNEVDVHLDEDFNLLGIEYD